jgi:hypothetical protein
LLIYIKEVFIMSLSQINSFISKNKKGLINILSILVIIILIFLIWRLNSSFITDQQLIGTLKLDTIEAFDTRRNFGNLIKYFLNIYGNNLELNLEGAESYRITGMNIKLGSKAKINMSYELPTTGETGETQPIGFPDPARKNILTTLLVSEDQDFEINTVLTITNTNVYTKKITVKFFNIDNTPLLIDNISNINTFIKHLTIYGMRKGSFDKTIYDKFTTGLNSITSNPSSILDNRNDVIDSNKKNHYFRTPDSRDKLIYSMYLSYNTKTATNIKPNSVYDIDISFLNSIKNTIYTIPNHFYLPANDNSTLIYFYPPILAKEIMMQTNNSDGITFNVNNTAIYGNLEPSATLIKTYEIPQFAMEIASETGQCPPIKELVNNQKLTQQLCDDLEYQDRIKLEKMKLEKEKQYLIKLKKQDEEIMALQNQIDKITKERQQKDKLEDQLKLARLQAQKEEAVELRDIAQEKLQKKQNLYLDVQIEERPSN